MQKIKRLFLVIASNILVFVTYLFVDISIPSGIVKKSLALGFQPPTTYTLATWATEVFNFLNQNIPFWWIPIMFAAIVATAYGLYRRFMRTA